MVHKSIKMTNNNPFSIKDSVENNSYLKENIQYNNVPVSNISNNIFWDFTLGNANSKGNVLNSSVINPRSQDHSINSNSMVSNEIDFNELLGPNKNKKTFAISNNNIRTMNKNDNKIDPFEGFY